MYIFVILLCSSNLGLGRGLGRGDRLRQPHLQVGDPGLVSRPLLPHLRAQTVGAGGGGSRQLRAPGCEQLQCDSLTMQNRTFYNLLRVQHSHSGFRRACLQQI